MTHAEEHRACRQTKLRDVVVQIEEGHAGVRTETDRGRSDLYFSARITVSPKIVSRGQRAILHCIEPVALALRLKRNRALNIAETASARRWILIVILVLRRGEGDNLEKRQD